MSDERQQEASRFLSFLDPTASFFTFQTFDDNAERAKAFKASNGGYPDPAMTRILHGPLAEHWDELARLNKNGCGIFVTINETDGQGRQIANITRVRALFLDLDGAPLEPVLASQYPPHLVVDTSPGKWHVYWLVNGVPLDEFTAIQRALIKLYGGDPAVHDLPRVMRIPGFHHRKGEPYLVVLQAAVEAEVYQGEVFRQPPEQIDVVVGVTPDGNDIEGVALKNLAAWVPKLFGSKARPYRKGYRINSRNLARGNEEDLSIQPTGIKDFGVHDLGDEKEGKRVPTDLVIEYGGAKSKFDAECWLCDCMGIPKPSHRPVIIVKSGQLAFTADKSEDMLLAADVELYHRANALVRPIIDEVEATKGKKTKTAALATVTQVYLRDLLSRNAQYAKFDAKKKLLNIDPPPEVVLTMMGRSGEFKFPRIAGVISSPTLRPDGSILNQPGYDQSTQLLMVASPPLPAMPERPSHHDALEALRVIEGLLSEFPLVDGVAMSVALSAILTPVVRGGFAVCPMHAARAPVAGGGKSYFMDLVASISTGQLMPVMAAGRTEEETEKRLGASLLTGQPLISIDNVNGVLGGDALCQIIERPVVDIRILGKSEKMRVEARGTSLFCTGNNIVLKGDLVRRTLTVNINPNVERPELREFRQRPVNIVLHDRGRYIAACLTICRAHLISTSDRARKLASFEDWSDMVRSALIWLGKDDPVASIDKARDEDPILNALRDVLTTWAEVMGVGERHRLTLLEFFTRVNETDPQSRELRWPGLFAAVRNAAVSRRDGIETRLFGYWLRENQERIVDGLQLKSRHNAHRIKEWWIEGAPRQGTYTAWVQAGSGQRFGVVPGGRRDDDNPSGGDDTPF